MYAQPPTAEGEVVAKPLREAWGKGETKKRESENQGCQENKNDTPPGISHRQIQELQTFVEMIPDDAERDRIVELWKSNFHRSIICDTEKLNGHYKIPIEANGGGRLSGMRKLKKYGSFPYFPTSANVVLGTEMGISGVVAEIYIEMGQHAEGTYLFAKIRGPLP